MRRLPTTRRFDVRLSQQLLCAGVACLGLFAQGLRGGTPAADVRSDDPPAETTTATTVETTVKTTDQTSDADDAAETPPLADAELADWRRSLLTRAFDIASAIPVDPHVKDRSKAQADVLDALLDLDQPLAVRDLATRIENWRRAEAIAKVALFAARAGVDPTEVRTLVALSDANHPADLAQWRHDRIDVKIARAMVRIGDLEAAARLEAGFERAAQGRVVEESVETMPAEAVPVLLERLDQVIELADLDGVMNAIDILVALHARFYDDVALRTDLERRVDDAATRGKVPHDIRVRANLSLVDEAVRRDDEANARMLVGRARGVLDSIQARTPFPAEYLVPLLGDLARRRAEAGDLERAIVEVEDAMTIADENRATIIDVFRARAMRPVALAAVATGDPELAERVFTAVVEAGAVNPNSRPRAEDLARTLAAMAVSGHQPGEGLQARIDEIVEGLGDPW